MARSGVFFSDDEFSNYIYGLKMKEDKIYLGDLLERIQSENNKALKY